MTLQLFRDLFTIFYEPLVRVYKSANVYNSVTDFATFADDMFAVVERAQRQDVSADPNQTVQSFIDLCARHQENFYRFIHEVHLHDNGLFTQLMAWIEGILEFLRHGPRGGKLDMNALFHGAVDMGHIKKSVAINEINALVKWQEERKKWHHDKTRQKMAADGSASASTEAFPGAESFKSSDFGLNEVCTLLPHTISPPLSFFSLPSFGLYPIFFSPPTNTISNLKTDVADLQSSSPFSSDVSDSESDSDPITAERKRRAKKQDHLRRSAGEPQKPDVKELLGMRESFLGMLRMVLAE